MSVPVTTYLDNAPTPAPTATVGFKVSKPGYDANTTSGSNMIYDSSWPSLSIMLETTVTNTITGPGSANIVIPHNLQYPPFAMAWGYGPDPYGSGRTNVATRFIPFSDSTNIYINYNSMTNGAITSATKITVLVYNLNLSVDIDYTLAPGATFNQPYDKSYGVKVVKKGKDINSKDLRDFSLHSRAQSPLVKSVKTQATLNHANDTSSSSIIQYTNKLTTPVWVYGFIKAGASGLASSLAVPTSTYCPAPYYSQSYPRTFTDGYTSYIGYNISGAIDQGATLVILRDPMFAANKQTVQY